ncbi:hypothetical protein D910_11069 [Dendroctonus ponderosae]|uniref:Uncharacterized protein n=1 Tax=Dendroctonus ponderosae TaxID=77166 RepID=U4UMR1_DENPD|nr:hypothetical protein D910_11069 [Dendroctonus ponderosae]
MTYASTVWGYAAETYLRQLQATEKNFCGWPYMLPGLDLEWEPLRDFLQRKAASTFEKAENHPLAELRNAVDYSPEDAGLRKKRSRHQMAQQGNSRNLFMLDNVDLETWRNVQWFQHDGAPPHNFSQVRNHLDVTFPGAWIGRNGPILWPPRSPDLSPLDFFWCGAVAAAKIPPSKLQKRNDSCMFPHDKHPLQANDMQEKIDQKSTLMPIPDVNINASALHSTSLNQVQVANTDFCLYQDSSMLKERASEYQEQIHF